MLSSVAWGASLIGLCVVFTLAGAPARADCVTRMSRIPMGGPRASAPPLRANMLRLAPAPPAHHPPAARKARAAHPPRPRKPLLHRLRHPRRGVRPLHHFAANGAPPSVDSARAHAAVPAAFALIQTTICEGGPAAAAGAGPSYRLESLLAPGFTGPPGAPALDNPQVPPLPPGVEPQTITPLIPFPTPPPLGPEPEPVIGPFTPTIAPPVTGPVTTPPTGPTTGPITGPTTGPQPPVTGPQPPGPQPPPGPPPVFQPPPVSPPVVPLSPPGPPPVTGVPEPAAWALLVAGFGLLGQMLRRQRRGRA